jgi:hypothetical protein
MTYPCSPEERAALLRGYNEALDAEAAAHNAELVRRVEAEAAAATALPWWWPEAAAVVFILTVALSIAFPMGVA